MIRKIIVILFWAKVTELTFISYILRELGLYLIHKRTHECSLHNILWIYAGFKEYTSKVNILIEIPMEYSMIYINHLYKCIYEED